MTETTDRAATRAAIPEFDLADRIRRAMRHAGVGTAELADRLQVARSSVSNWVNGHHTPRSRDLTAIAEICGVDMEWLMFGYDGGKDGLTRGTRRYFASDDAPASPSVRELLELRSPVTALRERVPTRHTPHHVSIRSLRVGTR